MLQVGALAGYGTERVLAFFREKIKAGQMTSMKRMQAAKRAAGSHVHKEYTEGRM
jgi:hypothetical protein